MTLTYHNFFGIDIGKFNFVVSNYGSKNTQEYTNDSDGINSFFKDHTKPDALYIVETTGGHEMNLLYALCIKGFAAHRANTRKVRNFIRSLGNGIKTDKLDVKALARYGFERSEHLSLFDAPSQKALELSQLTQRRHDLRQMLVAERNRSKAPGIEFIKSSCDIMVEAISKEIESVTSSINALVAGDQILAKKKETLQTIPGIGEIISNDLIAVLPELGNLDRRQLPLL